MCTGYEEREAASAGWFKRVKHWGGRRVRLPKRMHHLWTYLLCSLVKKMSTQANLPR